MANASVQVRENDLTIYANCTDLGSVAMTWAIFAVRDLLSFSCVCVCWCAPSIRFTCWLANGVTVAARTGRLARRRQPSQGRVCLRPRLRQHQAAVRCLDRNTSRRHRELHHRVNTMLLRVLRHQVLPTQPSPRFRLLGPVASCSPSFSATVRPSSRLGGAPTAAAVSTEQC